MFVTLSCTFRYGRDDMDVMGIAFRRELYLVTRQVYPPMQDRDKTVHTRVQAKLLRKLGNNAYPFFFEVRRDKEQDREQGFFYNPKIQKKPFYCKVSWRNSKKWLKLFLSP